MPRYSYPEPIAYEAKPQPFEIPQLVPDDEPGEFDAPHSVVSDHVAEPLHVEEEAKAPYVTAQILAQRAIRALTIDTDSLADSPVRAMPTYTPGRWIYDRK